MSYEGIILGDIPVTCRHDAGYFIERFCFVDCRGPLIIHENSYFGFGVKIITMSHDIKNWPVFGPASYRGVSVGNGSWIASFSILYNCTIGDHVIVSIGSVVNGLIVPDYSIVSGNPAKIVGTLTNKSV